jgi:HPt (histidine-containing phosphotransfer) domain-containing protein
MYYFGGLAESKYGSLILTPFHFSVLVLYFILLVTREVSAMADEVMYVNADEGVKRVMNNAKLYFKLLDKFKTGTTLDALNAALDAGDLEKAQTEVHTVKGVAANLSLSELFKQSLELENQIKAKAVDPNQVETVKTVFAATLQEVEKVIAQNG